MENVIRTVCTYYPEFFLVCKLYKSGLQVMPRFADHIAFIGSVDFGGV